MPAKTTISEQGQRTKAPRYRFGTGPISARWAVRRQVEGLEQAEAAWPALLGLDRHAHSLAAVDAAQRETRSDFPGSTLENFVDRAMGERDNEQVPVRTGLYVSCDAEFPADQSAPVLA